LTRVWVDPLLLELLPYADTVRPFNNRSAFRPHSRAISLGFQTVGKLAYSRSSIRPYNSTWLISNCRLLTLIHWHIQASVVHHSEFPG